MSGRASAATLKAMDYVRAGMSGYAAARQAGIALSTLYRSSLWKAYQAELETLKQENRRAS